MLVRAARLQNEIPLKTFEFDTKKGFMSKNVLAPLRPLKKYLTGTFLIFSSSDICATKDFTATFCRDGR